MLTDEAAHAVAVPITRPSRSGADVQMRLAPNTPISAMRPPSAAARAAVFLKAESPDETVESNDDSKERAHERPPRRGLKMPVEPISQPYAEETERRQLPTDAQRES